MKINNRHVLFSYAAVIYRDPIDYRPSPPSSPIQPEYQEQLDLIEKQMKDQILIENDIDIEEYENEIKARAAKYDRESYPFDKNVPIQFSFNIEEILTELEKVECGGGNDDAEDWVGGLNCALYDLKWRENSQKFIIWISDSNAHGKKFCGFDNHNEEEHKLERLVQQIAEKNIYFIGINLISEFNQEGCEQTLNIMKNIYEQFNAPNFTIIKSDIKEEDICYEYGNKIFERIPNISNLMNMYIKKTLYTNI